ncbi:MAG: Lpg1974 family pore-forming outer membrane protein [Gammaproteobacteria bacterium]
MQNKKQQFLFTFLALTTATSALAGFIPHEWEDNNKGIWQIGFSGEYLLESNNLANLDGVSVDHFTHAAEDDHLDLLFPELGHDPKTNWGYDVEAGYIFPSHKYDLRAMVNWQSGSEEAGAFGTIHSGGLNGNAEHNGKFNDDFAQAELTFGNYISLTKQLALRLGYGVSYVNIKQKAQGSAQFCAVPASCSNSAATFENKFSGVGPKLTVLGNFDISHSLTAVGGLGGEYIIWFI